MKLSSPFGEKKLERFRKSLLKTFVKLLQNCITIWSKILSARKILQIMKDLEYLPKVYKLSKKTIKLLNIQALTNL